MDSKEVSALKKRTVLQVQHGTMIFGKGRSAKTVLWDINFTVIAGEIVAILGPSGCGKSTLLRAIGGMEPFTEGQVMLFGAAGKEIPRQIKKPSEDIGIVYQDYGILPHLTAIENVAIGPKLFESSICDRAFRFVPLARQRRGARMSWANLRKLQLDEAAAMLEKFGLGDAKDKYPYQLSGGMKQRVAIAQALIMKPRVLLMDEPFSGLDEKTKDEFLMLLLNIYKENIEKIRKGEQPLTVIIVTHQIEDAILVGDSVIGVSKFWDHESPDPRAEGAATVVYDRASPVFVDTRDKDHPLLAEQKAEIFGVVFNPDNKCPRDRYRLFWEDIIEGKGRGVLNGKEICTASAEGGGKDG